MDEKTRTWLKSGKYLPRQLRDFHDAKTAFKVMHRCIAIENNVLAKDVSWVTGQGYVIDIFLWFMAMNGYTLQKNRSKQNFADLDETIKKWDAVLRNESGAVLKSLLGPAVAGKETT